MTQEVVKLSEANTKTEKKEGDRRNMIPHGSELSPAAAQDMIRTFQQGGYYR